MERNSLSSSLRDHSINSNTTKNNINNKMMLKDPLNCNNNSQQNHCYGSGGEDYVSGFSWPPRCYTCSFCKREFRSAQALGGHMNVHRRDRARLRQSPPLPSPPPPPPPGYGPHAHYNYHHHHHHHHPILNLNLNLKPNPKPNFSTSLSPSALSSLVSSSISALSSPSSTSPSKLKKWVVDLDPSSDGCNIVKTTGAAGESVRLNLEIGQVSDDSKVDLDLELRLGYC